MHFQFINGQPRIQQVTDEFLWAQWDSQHQRLYLVYPKHKVRAAFSLYSNL